MVCRGYVYLFWLHIPYTFFLFIVYMKGRYKEFQKLRWGYGPPYPHCGSAPETYDAPMSSWGRLRGSIGARLRLVLDLSYTASLRGTSAQGIAVTISTSIGTSLWSPGQSTYTRLVTASPRSIRFIMTVWWLVVLLDWFTSFWILKIKNTKKN
jgi:hypothetical protein